MQNPLFEPLLTSIQNRSARIGVVGLGYVGLPLVLEFAHAGFQVVGLDIDPEKINRLLAGKTYIKHIAEERLQALNATGRFTATTDYALARDCDALILCVPTPLTRNREPDMRYVEQTALSLAPHVRPGQVVSLESTTYPGTTRDVLIPALEEGSGLKAGVDFCVVYSPEREDPNNGKFTTATIPKVVGGWTSDSLKIGEALYGAIVQQTVPVSSCEVAEASKLLENIFRSVNIAMVNELKVVFTRMGIDIWEVIEAAKTKPFGYMPFYPGPGLGGHCIPIDPFYLTWKAREYETTTRFIELAGEINTAMPEYVVHELMNALNEVGKPLKGSRILLVGLAYKPDVDDMRESPTLKILELLEHKGAEVFYHDPYIPEIKPSREYPHLAGRHSTPLEEALTMTAVVIVTHHKALDYQSLVNNSALIVDTRNALAQTKPGKALIVKA
ncbi:MAG: nucleotide sugar dehydrogenase [Candidatus Sumerlaeia bacterium]|nr:nucleotide sugar dehydrogenase [Candidatus Sumerlaeia bacterium]